MPFRSIYLFLAWQEGPHCQCSQRCYRTLRETRTSNMIAIIPFWLFFKSEALARVLIDRIVTELCLFLKRNLSCIPYILVELTVGSLCHKPAIIECKRTNNALSLTGRLDYTILNLLLGPTDLVNSLELKKLEVERGKQSAKKIWHVSLLNKGWKQYNSKRVWILCSISPGFPKSQMTPTI